MTTLQCRKKPAQLAELSQSPSASFTLFHKYEALVTLPGAGGVQEGGYGWLQVPGPYARLEGVADADVGCIFLGLDQGGAPHFALNVTDAGRDGVAELLKLPADVSPLKAVGPKHLQSSGTRFLLWK